MQGSCQGCNKLDCDGNPELPLLWSMSLAKSRILWLGSRSRVTCHSCYPFHSVMETLQWKQLLKDDLQELYQSAVAHRESLVPMIAKIPLPQTKSEALAEIATMHGHLIGGVPGLVEHLKCFLWFHSFKTGGIRTINLDECMQCFNLRVWMLPLHLLSTVWMQPLPLVKMANWGSASCINGDLMKRACGVWGC